MDIRIDLHEIRDNSHLAGCRLCSVSHTASATMLKHHGYINYLSVETRSPVPQAVKMLAQFGPAPAPGLAFPHIHVRSPYILLAIRSALALLGASLSLYSRSTDGFCHTECHSLDCGRHSSVFSHSVGCGLHSASTPTDKAGESARPCARHARLISLALVLPVLRYESVCSPSRRATRGNHERSPTTYGSQRVARPSKGRTSAAPP